MATFRTILVPTDFGASAEAALDHAIGLARAFGGSVVMLHAFQVPALGMPDAALAVTAELEERIREAAAATLGAAAVARRDSGVPIRTVLEESEPWRATLDVARREGADLIVLGTHGRRGLPRALLGSVAEKVVRTSPVPVLTVRAATKDAPDEGAER